MTDSTAPDPRRAAYGRRVGQALFRGLYRPVALHPERVPADGPVLLVANHAALIDGPLVFTLSPRPVSFLVKQEAFVPVIGSVLRGVGQIPIDRGVGDRAALKAATDVLGHGGVVGVFPEGTRGEGEVAEVNQGAAWIAMRSGARVVPVAVMGTRAKSGSPSSLPRPWSRLTVAFGEPFVLAPDPSLPGRERLRVASDDLRERLASHVRASRVENGTLA